MKGKKIYWNHLIVHLILLAGVAVVVFPFLWMIFTSFKTTGESLKIPPTIFPEKFVTDAYTTIMSSAIPFGQVYLNTFLSTVITTLVQIIFCSMAGYAFAMWTLAAGVSLLAVWLLLLTMDALDLTHFSFLPALLEVGVLVALSGVVLGGLLDYLALRKTHLT